MESLNKRVILSTVPSKRRGSEAKPDVAKDRTEASPHSTLRSVNLPRTTDHVLSAKFYYARGGEFGLIQVC